MKERWVNIDGYNGDYKVSNEGSVVSYKRQIPIELKPCKSNWDYFRVVLHKGGNPIKCSIHRLVAEAFIPNPENKPEVNHIDGDKGNNNASNLEWCTRSENTQHSYDIGTMKRGENHGRAKVSKEDVINIRELYSTGIFTQKELGESHGLTQAVISKIIRRDIWTHI